ncbi:MAG: FAD:protein FMN transferase [Planctomycetota bacterium]|jgi:thiamine biosynthesis lipoprotein
MNRRAILLATIIIVVLVAVLWSNGTLKRNQPRYVSFTEEIMASPITVLAPAAEAEAAARLVFDIFRDVDATMSEWKAGSPLSAVNQAAGRHPVKVPDDLRQIIHKSIEIGDMTDGAFDITWAALWGLWDFKAARPHVPTDEEIAERVELIDYHRIVIDDEAGTVYLPQAGMVIGLGGIAKGYALDRSAAALHDRGIDSFLISAAGQMRLSGLRSGRRWRVGVRDPRGTSDDYFAFLELTNVSVSTSGDYERHFILDGVRYHHILDPRTGKPSRGVRSATVTSGDATLADALSTAAMILGAEQGLALLEQRPGVEGLLVDGEGKAHVTSGLAGRLQRRHPPAP